MVSMTTQKDLALFLKNPKNARKLNGLVQDIRHALMDYQVCPTKWLALAVLNICSDFVTTRHLHRALRADRESRSLTIPLFVVTCRQGDADHHLLEKMRHAADAGHRSGDRQGFLRGTRTDVLLQLERWRGDEQDNRVFWLNGLAGTGKSTIAQTFADISFADGKLGASFFCLRSFEDRSNLRAIFPTLAFQLAYRYPPFRERLVKVLRANPDVGRESLC